MLLPLDRKNYGPEYLLFLRKEDSRVGLECSSRSSPYHENNKGVGGWWGVGRGGGGGGGFPGVGGGGPLGPLVRGRPPQARGGARSGQRQRRGCLAVGARQRRRAGMQGWARSSCADCDGTRASWVVGRADMQRVGGGMWRFGSSGGWFARRPASGACGAGFGALPGGISTAAAGAFC